MERADGLAQETTSLAGILGEPIGSIGRTIGKQGEIALLTGRQPSLSRARATIFATCSVFLAGTETKSGANYPIFVYG